MLFAVAWLHWICWFDFDCCFIALLFCYFLVGCIVWLSMRLVLSFGVLGLIWVDFGLVICVTCVWFLVGFSCLLCGFVDVYCVWYSGLGCLFVFWMTCLLVFAILICFGVFVVSDSGGLIWLFVLVLFVVCFAGWGWFFWSRFWCLEFCFILNLFWDLFSG